MGSEPRFLRARSVAMHRLSTYRWKPPGPSGTAGKHWSEAIFGNELLTGFAEAAGVAMPLSILTIASLRDIGSVDYTQAEPYNLA